VETAGASGVLGAAVFLAVEEAVCDFWSGGAASSRVPHAIRVKRLAETTGRRRFTDSSIEKQQAAKSSPEYHRLKSSNPSTHPLLNESSSLRWLPSQGLALSK
jgi:hypothetical protein